GKWQLSWKVQHFGKEEAELLQRCLARDTGADPAATDCARVLRLPGFYNHKYGQAHLVRFERLSADTYEPSQFPTPSAEDRSSRPWQVTGAVGARKRAPGQLSQSERDWSFA